MDGTRKTKRVEYEALGLLHDAWDGAEPFAVITCEAGSKRAKVATSLDREQLICWLRFVADDLAHRARHESLKRTRNTKG